MKSSTPIGILHNLIHTELMSQSTLDTSEEKFRQLLAGIEKAYYAFQPRYEISFNKPLTAKRKYYYALIEKASTQYLNSVTDDIAASSNINERKFSVSTSLKSISKLLSDASNLVGTYSLHFKNLETKSPDKETLDKTYIIQALRLHLCRIYLEIQDSNIDFLKEEPLPFDELNEKYFSDSIPNSYIKDAPKLKSNDAFIKNNKSASEEKPTFVPQAFDFRGKKDDVLSYNEIIKSPSLFSRFEESLYQNEFIDEKGKFRKSDHGKKEPMAAIYQTLIHKGYFNKYKFVKTKRKEIQPLDIRKFLDERYQSALDAQFRTWGRNQKKLAEFIGNHYWIDKLPTC